MKVEMNRVLQSRFREHFVPVFRCCDISLLTHADSSHQALLVRVRGANCGIFFGLSCLKVLLRWLTRDNTLLLKIWIATTKKSIGSGDYILYNRKTIKQPIDILRMRTRAPSAFLFSSSFIHCSEHIVRSIYYQRTSSHRDASWKYKY